MIDGFVKVAAASPVIRLADCDYNAERVIETIKKADALGAKVLVFPELTLTGVSCYDLITHRVILEGAKKALDKVIDATKGIDMLCFVGLPWADGAEVFSAAAAVCSGELLAVLSGDDDEDERLFIHSALDELCVAVEIGAGLDRAESGTDELAASGATLIAQMASFPATTSSTQEAELNIRYESRRGKAGLILAAPGTGESTTDNWYSGLCLVAENGRILARDERADSLAVSEIDVQALTNLRRASGGFDGSLAYDAIPWGAELTETAVTRRYPMHPHLP